MYIMQLWQSPSNRTKIDKWQHTRQAPVKRLRHANATHRNIVGHNMLRAFGHRVATCCEVLGVVGSNLTIFKPEPTTPNMSQHIAIWWPNARNMLRPTMLWYVVLAWCDCLTGASVFFIHSPKSLYLIQSQNSQRLHIPHLSYLKQETFFYYNLKWPEINWNSVK